MEQLPQDFLLWNAQQPAARLVLPSTLSPSCEIVQATLNGWLKEFFGWTLPLAEDTSAPGLYVVAGNPKNNPALAELVRSGLSLEGQKELGDEGFRLLSLDAGPRRFIIITANSAAGLKHGCQELLFYRLKTTGQSVSIDYPLDVRMKPQFAYRGVYMLPCWAAFDSIDSWKRVLRFHSELTLNRNWFWLAGFPLLPEYGGEYEGSELAKPENIDSLIHLCHAEAMNFLIGGGWYTWHHEKIAEGSIERGLRYYLDLLERFPQADGLYLEPMGEGRMAPQEVWSIQIDAMKRLVHQVLREKPESEFAVAIGHFNEPAFRRAVHEIDDQRLYWWWCWGDPSRDNALSEHPLMLRWHVAMQMSEYHGSLEPPKPEETSLAGFATSYDPGMGYGNPWTGWDKLGVDFPRNFDPRTLPYFSHQYWFRERCWNVRLTPEQFAERMQRRLFDADMPAESIAHYLDLAGFCRKAREANAKRVGEINEFVTHYENHGTARNRDTLIRMREALTGIEGEKAKAGS